MVKQDDLEDKLKDSGCNEILKLNCTVFVAGYLEGCGGKDKHRDSFQSSKDGRLVIRFCSNEQVKHAILVGTEDGTCHFGLVSLNFYV